MTVVNGTIHIIPVRVKFEWKQLSASHSYSCPSQCDKPSLTRRLVWGQRL